MGTTLINETKWNLVETDVHEVGIKLSSMTEWMVSRTWKLEIILISIGHQMRAVV